MSSQVASVAQPVQQQAAAAAASTTPAVKTEEKLDPAKVFVGNLPYAVTDEELLAFMKKVATSNLVECRVARSARSGRSRGYGLVQYATPAEGERAVAELNDQLVGDRKVFVRINQEPNKVVEAKTATATTGTATAQTERKPRRFRRRGPVCYNCNRPGHLARDCKATAAPASDKCYNCGQAGHFARDCKAPKVAGAAPAAPTGGYRRRGPRCYNCGKYGHFARDCTAAAMNNCYNCGKPGHFARDCKSAPAAGAAAAAPTAFAGVCYNCNKPGHLARDCTAAPAETTTQQQSTGGGRRGGRCFNCGKPGHLARDCTEAPTTAETRTCYNCHKPGHFARDCTEAPAGETQQ